MPHANTHCKLSDYVASYVAGIGVRQVFIISGGASIHLLHSLAERGDIEPVCPHHEQAAAMAADGYARAAGGIGCAMGTSGPGATNLITGIAGAYFDSVPCLFVTGQVATYRMKGNTGIRQMGFQETDILPMVAPITKYAVQISNPKDIAYELEKAVHIALTGRPGPVLIDIPDDLQRAFINLSQLPRFEPPSPVEAPKKAPSQDEIDELVALIGKAKRPVFVLGFGVRLAGAVTRALDVAERLSLPVLTSWAAKDMISNNHPLLAGTFGTHGTRAGNFTIQNADLIIAVGARLSTHETGTPMTSFVREGKLVVVDIDRSELAKFAHFGKPLALSIEADAAAFLETLQNGLTHIAQAPLTEWKARIGDWIARYPVGDGQERATSVNPYRLMERLSGVMAADEQVFIDTGCAVAWMMQGFPVRGKQRLHHDFNNTSMGWALPAAIGGCFALKRRPVTCVAGDGSLMMNVQELATVRRHSLPIKMFVLNNNGYSMVRQTQDQWLGSKYFGTSTEGGLWFPDFCRVAEAFAIPAYRITSNGEVQEVLTEVYGTPGPALVDIHIAESERVIPQARFGYPIEDPEPLLPREEFLKNMIVEPLAKSREPIG